MEPGTGRAARGRGNRGVVRPAPVQQQLSPAEEEIAQGLEQVGLQPPVVAEPFQRPVGRGTRGGVAGVGRARGRAVTNLPEPTPPGLPSGVQPPEVTSVETNVYLEEEKTLVAPAVSPAPAAPEVVAQAPAQPAAEEPPAAAPTLGGSESFTAVHLDKSGLEPVLKHGEKGEKIPIATNFIRVNLAENKGMYEYRVEFTPAIDATDMKKRALYSCDAVIGLTKTFDGQTLYLPQNLPTELTEVSVPNPNDPSTNVLVKIKFIKKQTMLDSVQFYNVLMRRIQKELGHVEMGRNFYDARLTHQIPQHKLEIWPGTITRIDEVEGGLMLCLDASHRVLRQDTVLDMWHQIKKTPRGNPQEIFRDFIIGKLVLTHYNQQCHRVDDVTWQLTPSDCFERKGEKVSFMDYYKKQYGLTITDSTQPMLVSNPKERRNAKPDAKKHFVTLIPEFCRMSGLSDEQIANFNVMKDVAQFTRVTPQQRAMLRLLQSSSVFISACQKARDILAEWGLDFEDALLEISGRIVAAPNLEFNTNFTLKPGKPDFSREATTNACYRPVGLRRYVVLCTRNDRAKADNMVRTYKQVCGALGIHTGAPGEVIAVNGNTPKDFRDALHEYIHPDKVQVVFVILPVPRDDLYAAVKKFCVVERPIPSQVVLSKTLNNEKRLRSVMQKIALQVNCKLGGALWALKIPMAAKIMFCGVDVYHDPKRKNPSVTAFVASMDTSCTSYYSRVIFQKPHQENLDSLIAVFVNALEEFRDINGTLPDRVIVFRDGVSDGQWETVKQTEVKQLTNGLNIALANEPGKNCLFSFVVVQKKINERFFALNGRKVDNPVPGSVLDNTVNRRYFYDFFIVSQLVRQGTVSPTHFIVLEDTSNIKPDLIQKFAFATTFMYFNWPGTIRVPAMCQYAHKLAYLTGQHVKSEPAASHCHSLYYL